MNFVIAGVYKREHVESNALNSWKLHILHRFYCMLPANVLFIFNMALSCL